MQINLNLENAGANTLQGGVTTFGQVFKQGELPAGTGLKALVGGVAVAVQLDVKTTYADGSAKMAVVSLERPDLAAGASAAVVLSEAAAPAGGAAVDLAAALSAHSMTVDLTGSGAHASIDVMAALQQALKNGTASFWQEGALATQARVEVPLEGSQRLVFDVTAFKGGGLEVEAQVNNDGAMGAAGGRVNSVVTVTLDGERVAHEVLNQGQYQNWHETFSTTDHDGGQGLGEASSGWLNIRQDIAHLQQTGAIANYDLGLTLHDSLLQSFAEATAAAGWDTPLSTNGVTQYMPGVGGRADIGITTESNTAWLLTQDIRAATYALGQAETASAVPWNMWDAANGRWLSTDQYPQLWTDVRGGTGTPGDAASGTLTQHGDDISGWSLDSAHQPDLSFVPYILTGERWMLDNLQAQGAWNIISQWTALRGEEGNLIVQGNQVRGSAWALRQIDEAAWASPDGSVEQAYFSKVSEANWSWIVQQLPTWTAEQGEAHGWLPGEYGTEGALPPWQQDYFASTAIAAARHGNADALTYLEWASNFLVGRFQHAADGFAEHDGAAYLLAISDPATGRVFNTWAEIGATTTAYGWSNGDGWSHTDGDYAQLALATLSGIAELTGSQAAADVYHALLAQNPPFTADSNYASDPTFAIAAPGEVTTPVLPSPTPGGIATPPVAVPEAVPDNNEAKPVEPAPEAPSTNHPAGEVPLSIVLGGEAWEGNPLAVVLVNGVEAFRGEVTASHAGGGAEIALGHVAAGAAHDVVVQFLNDGWGGSADTDRNLYVEDIRINGVSTGSTAALLDGNSDAQFSITAPAPVVQQPAAPAPLPQPMAGEVPLSIVLGGEAWEGNPLAVVLVNGVEAFRGEVTASHAGGGAEIALGHVAAGAAHDVVVQFLNDGWGGSADTDRNLYVEDIRINGVSTGSTAALLDGNSDAQFSITAPAPLPQPVAGEVPLSIVLGGEAWEGNPLAVVLVNGVEAFRGEVTASHAGGGAEIALGHVAAGAAHDVVVQFLNDGWGGSADTDRNLYVEDIRINGVSTGSTAALLDGNSDAQFSITAPAPVVQQPAAPAPLPQPVAGEVPLSIVLGGEAWEGNPLAVVLVNGVEAFRGEVTASHAGGGAEIALGHVAASAAHDVVVQFLNDGWGGSADTDRNLYVEDIRINGVSTGSTAALLDGNSDAQFSIATGAARSSARSDGLIAPTSVAEHATAMPAAEVSFGTLHTDMFWSQSSLSGLTLNHGTQADGGFLGASGMLTGTNGSLSFANTDVIHFADGRLVFDAGDVVAQVMRLYQAALGREPDSLGQENWTAELNHGASLSKLAAGFMGSEEFHSRFGQMDDTGFIVRTYEQVLGREPEAAGLSHWQDQLAHGLSRADMLVGFSESAENREHTQGLLANGLWDVDDQMADIARLYKAVLDRAPDAAGLQFWDAKADGGMATADMANHFAQSNEFQTRFPGASDADFVQMVYANTLGRAGEAAGEAFWLDQLTHGMTRGEVVAGFADSHEFLQLSQPLTDHGIVLG